MDLRILPGNIANMIAAGEVVGSSMPLETKHCIIRGHPAAVVDDLDQGPSRVGDNDCHLVGSCIHRILHKFLDHR